MRLAFTLFSYFPYGGLERNFKAVADECAVRDHEIDVYTMQWQGRPPETLNVKILPAKGRSNHRRAEDFVKRLRKQLVKNPPRLVIGFNKIPGLDLYYAGDTCYLHRMRRERSILSRLTPRFRSLAHFEDSVFSSESRTEIIYISEKEKDIYREIYRTPESRFHYAPPGVNKDFIRSSLNPDKRGRIRSELGLADDDNLLLMIGSNFKTKGVDRSIKALASLPEALLHKTYLVVVGKGKEKMYKKMARRLHISDKVVFTGGRDDVPAFLADADLVLQPSVNENTGNPIVEAIVAGVPVLATETCGFSGHIRASGAGEIIPCNPFEQQVMNRILTEVLLHPDKNTWRRQALAYSNRVDLYNRVPAIVDVIEKLGRVGA